MGGKIKFSSLSAVEQEAVGYGHAYANKLYDKALVDQATFGNCQEDFAAGYVAAGVKRQKKLDFLISQLQQILELSAAYGETYSCSIAKYSLEKVSGK